MFGNWGTTLLVDDGVEGRLGHLRPGRVLGGGHSGSARHRPRLRTGSCSTHIYVVLPWAHRTGLAPCSHRGQRGALGSTLFTLAGLGVLRVLPDDDRHSSFSWSTSRSDVIDSHHRRTPAQPHPRPQSRDYQPLGRPPGPQRTQTTTTRPQIRVRPLVRFQLAPLRWAEETRKPAQRRGRGTCHARSLGACCGGGAGATGGHPA